MHRGQLPAFQFKRKVMHAHLMAMAECFAVAG
jgi:hypothetical protein